MQCIKPNVAAGIRWYLRRNRAMFALAQYVTDSGYFGAQRIKIVAPTSDSTNQVRDRQQLSQWLASPSFQNFLRALNKLERRTKAFAVAQFKAVQIKHMILCAVMFDFDGAQQRCDTPGNFPT